MRQLDTLVGDGGRNRSQRQALAAQFNDPPDGALLVEIFGKGTALSYLPAERDAAAEIPEPLALVGLHVADALANAIAAEFQERIEQLKQKKILEARERDAARKTKFVRYGE